VCAVFASAAAGADVIFLEKALSAGLDCHVVLPFPVAEFERTSVADIGGDWVARFHAVLEAASSVTVVDDGFPENTGGALAFCNLVMTARASACARAWGMPLRALAVWDRLPAAGAGGTAECVGIFRDAGLLVDVVDPLRADEGTVAVGGSGGGGPLFANMPSVRAGETGSEVSVMTGLRVNGYEDLGEAGLVGLERDVFGRLADLLAGEAGCLSCQGHCGEYVFFWDSPGAAGRAAPGMLALLGSEARERGLGVGFSMLLHVAPMQMVVNPLVHQYSREGRAAVALLKGLARLAPGVVHATGRFADLLALEPDGGLVCTYAGTLDAAGGPLGYRIHRLEKASRGHLVP
jgi:hypothetical protein